MSLLESKTFRKVLKTQPVEHWGRDNSVCASSSTIQCEHELVIRGDGLCPIEVTCSAEHLEELVVGRLRTDESISSVDDIEDLSFSEDSSEAQVVLSARAHRTLALKHGAVERTAAKVSPVRPIPWRMEWICELARVFEKDSPMHRMTRGAHSCYLAEGSRILRCYEDLGRHNAFDKAIGWAVIERIDLSQCTIFTSGRIPTDMLRKALNVGVPVLVSKTVPTDKTVELARACNMTLICNASSTGADVFSAGLLGAEQCRKSA